MTPTDSILYCHLQDKTLSVIDKARSDKRILTLLSDVSARTKIKYHKTNDGGWGSYMEQNTAHISYSGCKHPSASLAHELLHIDTQLRGYKRIRIFFSSIDQTILIKNLMDALDNELQHHKFYKNFIDLGFAPIQFYQDSDAETEGYLKEILTHSFNSILEVVPQFLTAIAPGGIFSQDARENIKNSFLALNGRQFSSQLIEIERIIVDWASSSSYDAIETIRNILLTIQPDNNLTWIGHNDSDRPPHEGFFVDKPFIAQMPT